jgi:hypoxanthine phosphoribosyltransferase
MEETDRGPRFAHPVEEALARAFDELGIVWRYEPRTFPLEWRDGVVVEACTVTKQRLATRKNRKYRKLRNRFGVVAEIMYRRDFIRLGRRHGLPELERAARRS